MKQNQKGFTLIELLAVIVILAIIALIATPIVMNVINQARKKAAEDSVFGIVEAVKSYHAERMLDVNSTVKDGITVKWETNNNTTTVKVDDTSVTDFKISGTRPTAGTVTINSNGTTTVTNLKVNGYTCNGSAESNDIKCEIQ